jgi:hypothetical protein
LELIFTTSSSGIITLEKWKMEDRKFIMGLKTIINQWIFGYGISKNSFLGLLLLLLFYMDAKFGYPMGMLSRIMEKDKIQNNFIMYNLKIKGNMPYPFLFLEASLSPIERTTMTRYVMYKNKLNNMKEKRLPKISLNSNRDHLQLKQEWHKDAQSWLNHWGIKEEIIL